MSLVDTLPGVLDDGDLGLDVEPCAGLLATLGGGGVELEHEDICGPGLELKPEPAQPGAKIRRKRGRGPVGEPGEAGPVAQTR